MNWKILEDSRSQPCVVGSHLRHAFSSRGYKSSESAYSQRCPSFRVLVQGVSAAQREGSALNAK